MIHKRIREVECTRSWKETVKSTRLILAKGWDPTAWACEVGSLDVLGDFPALQKSIVEHERDVDGSDLEIRSYKLYTVGRMHQALGEYELALAAYMRASAMAPSVEIKDLARLQTSTINVFLDAHEEALSNLLSVRDEALARHDYFSAAHAADFLADRELRVKDLAQAGAHASDARNWATLAGNQYRLDWVLALEGQIAYAGGKTDEGLDRLRRAQSAFASTGAHGSEMHCAARLGEALIESGLLDEARTVLARGADLSATHRFNVSRIKILRLNAKLKKRTGEIREDDYKQIMRRADILAARSQKSWGSVYGRQRVFSVGDVAEFLATLNPTLFEVVCKQILEFEGFQCTLTPPSEPYVDILARKKRQPQRWGVSCKRVMSGVGLRDIPDRDALLTLNSNALILMTTGKISGHAKKRVELLKSLGVPVEGWEGVRICEYLAAHDWILADVGTQLPKRVKPPRRTATSPRPRARS